MAAARLFERSVHELHRGTLLPCVFATAAYNFCDVNFGFTDGDSDWGSTSATGDGRVVHLHRVHLGGLQASQHNSPSTPAGASSSIRMRTTRSVSPTQLALQPHRRLLQ